MLFRSAVNRLDAIGGIINGLTRSIPFRLIGKTDKIRDLIRMYLSKIISLHDLLPPLISDVDGRFISNTVRNRCERVLRN